MDVVGTDLRRSLLLGLVAYAQSGAGRRGTTGTSSQNGCHGDIEVVAMQRVNGAIRWGAFGLATYTLSLFLAGWREINTTGHWTGFALLAAGVIFTGLLLALQAYWIYFEEKNKGSLRRSSKFFESVHAFVETRFGSNKLVRLLQPVISVDFDKKGSNK